MINIISFLLLFFAAFNAVDTGEKLLKNLQDKFDKIEDLSTDFKQTTNSKSLLAGRFLFKKEDRLRIEFKNSTLISDGVTNWSYNQKEHKVIISKNEETDATPFSLKKIIYDYPKQCEISTEKDNGEDILVLTPNANSFIGYSLIKIWLTKEHLINRMILQDSAENLIQIEFSKYKVNQKVPDSKFFFSPPEGSKVIDLR